MTGKPPVLCKTNHSILQFLSFDWYLGISGKKSVLLVLIFPEVSLITFSSIQFDSFPICKL